MMHFEDDDSRAAQKSKSSPNSLAFNSEADIENLRRLRKYGFFHGNSSRRFSMSLTLPKQASNSVFSKALNSLLKSKKVVFVKDLSIKGWTKSFPARDEVKFGHLLQRTKKIKRFSLDKKWSESINPRFIKLLAKGFSKIYDLKEVKLNLFSCNDIQTEDCRRLAKALSRSFNLQSIDLNMVGCNGIKVIGLHYLAFRLSRLRNLKALSLDLSNCACLRNEAGVLKFEDSIGRLVNSLQSLKIALNSDSLVGDAGLQDIARAVWKLKKLKELYLNLGSCSVGNMGLSNLSEAIQNLGKLEDVVLEFWGCPDIDDSGITQLSRAYTGLKEAKKIELNVSNCHKITDAGIETLNQSLQRLVNIENLSLNLYGCEGVSEREVTYFKNVWEGRTKSKGSLSICK